MTIPVGYAVIDIPLDRADEQLAVNEWGFAMAIPEAARGLIAGIIPRDRARGIEVAEPMRGPVGELAAVHSSFPFRMRVPGGADIAVSGLTWVSVHPGHRRRGLLRTMINDHFVRSLSRGESVSALYAAETKIYQKFGYGCVGSAARINLGRTPDMRELPGASELPVRLEIASLERHSAIVRAVQARIMRPGTVTVLPDETLRDLFADMPEWRQGREAKRFAWTEDADGPSAYAIFRRKEDSENWIPNGETHVEAWGAATSAGLQRLFAVVADLDLMTQCFVDRVPLDSPIFHMMQDPRGLKPTLLDNMWLRILDVPAALAARGYAHDLDVRIEVTDAIIPENAYTWRLVAQGGGASAEVTRAERDAPPDLRIDIQELSAVFLGGVPLASVAQAGLVEERRLGAVNAVSRAMLADEQAVCSFGF